MLSSDSSDSEEDLQVKEILEAADTALLSNSMFENDNKTDLLIAAKQTTSENQIKSQRYLDETDEEDFLDIIPPNVKDHVAKKLADVLKSKYEFCDFHKDRKTKKRKSILENCVKLVNNADCYVDLYDDFCYDNIGPQKKPEIKRRIIEGEIDQKPTKTDLKTLAVDSDSILRGDDLKHWQAKKQRKDKIFHYKSNCNGVLFAVESPNEFTSLRLHNNWNESKIKNRLL